MVKFNVLFLLLLFIFSKANAKDINDYFKNEKCKQIVDSLIIKNGGKDTLLSKDFVFYQSYLMMNLLGSEVSFNQKVYRKNKLFKMVQTISGEEIITGYDGIDVYQEAHGFEYLMTEPLKEEVLFAFRSTLPHQFLLKFIDKEYNLKYDGIKKIQDQDCFMLTHEDVFGTETHYFEVKSGLPLSSEFINGSLKWEVLRSGFIDKDGVKVPVIVTLLLNKALIYKMTIADISFDEKAHSSNFKKNNLNKINKSLDPMFPQKQLREIYQALQLFREYDPINHSYPDGQELNKILGYRPQLGRPQLKIGRKDMLQYHVLRGDHAKVLLFESYFYQLAGEVHPSTPLIWDKNGNFLNGRNVLFADGSVQFLNENQFQAYLNKAIKRYPQIEVIKEKDK